MDLAAFGSRAVILKPPPHQHKPSLSPRGWVGSFLGRSRYSKGAYDVLVGQRVVTSSSVLVDEEHFDWAPPPKRHQPLTALAHAAAPPPRLTLPPGPSLSDGHPSVGPPIVIEPLPPFPPSSRPPFAHGGAPTSVDGGASPMPHEPPISDGGGLSPSSPPSLFTGLRDPRASPITFPSLDTSALSPDAPQQRAVRARVPVDYFKKQPRKREWGPKWVDAVGADPNVSRTLAPVPEETPPPAPLPPPSPSTSLSHRAR